MSSSAVQAGKRATYPTYKPSGVAWVGDVPEHWELARADSRLKASGTPVTKEWLNGKEVFHYSIPVVQDTGTGAVEEGDHIDSGKTLLRDTALLVSKLNPRKGTIVTAVPQSIPTVCSGEFIAMTAKSCSSDYAEYAYRSEGVRQYLDSTVESVTRSHQRANPAYIRKLLWCWPPLDEQRAIAAFLDRETARIDALIEKKRRQIELLQEKRSALISHAVTKGLDPNAPMKDSGIEWLGDIPAHWTVGNIRRFAKMRTGHTPSRTNSEYWHNCTISWFTLADVWQLRDGRRKYLGETKEKISELGLANSAAELLPQGTVVFSRTASVGFSGIMPQPMATSQDFWNWVCLPSLLPEYLLCLFRAMRQEFEAITMGSTHKTIYQPIAAGIMICVPPFDEQHEIAAHVDAETGRIDSLVEKVEQSIEGLRELRTALISAAVTGKIDVREGGVTNA